MFATAVDTYTFDDKNEPTMMMIVDAMNLFFVNTIYNIVNLFYYLAASWCQMLILTLILARQDQREEKK
jgi:hypothetical protein